MMMRPPVVKELQMNYEEMEKGGVVEHFLSSQIACTVAQDTLLCSSL